MQRKYYICKKNNFLSLSNGLELYPKLRFPEFTEPWKSYHLGDIYDERTERGGSDVLLSVTINSGVILRTEIDGKDNSSDDKKNYKTVEIGDMVYNTMRMWQGASGISSYVGIVSPAYTVLKAKQKIDNLFFATLFKNSILINKFRCNSQGLTSDTWNLKYPQIKTIKVAIPTYAEQKRIADMINILNKRIEKQAAYIEILKKYKRGVTSQLLTGMISISKTTNINNWMIKTLADVTSEFKSGKTITASNISDTGTYPVYGGNGIRGYTSDYNHNGLYVVIGRQGALCGNVRLINGKNYLSEHAIAVKANEQNDSTFLLYLLEKMHLGQYSDQGAQPGLAVNKLLKLKSKFPPLDEQIKIGQFLKAHDKKLVCENRFLHQLNQVKFFLLNKLFI